MNALLYMLAGCFLAVGGLLLAVFMFYEMSSYVGVDADPNLALGGLLCLIVGLLLWQLVSLAEIRRTLRQK